MNRKVRKKKSYINPRHILVALALILVAFVAVYAYQELTKPKEIKLETVKSADDKFKKIIADCDALSKRPWDKPAYEAILSEISAGQSTSLFSAVEAGNMENMLRVAFANSLHIASENWRGTDGTIEPTGLRDEVALFHKYEDCKVILAADMLAFDAYYLALQAPARVDAFLGRKYDSSTASALYTFLVTNCQHESIAHFSRLQDIFKQELNKMEAFRDFAKEYDAAIAYYRLDTEGRRSYMQNNFCPENNEYISIYQFYLDQIKAENICYP